MQLLWAYDVSGMEPLGKPRRRRQQRGSRGGRRQAGARDSEWARAFGQAQEATAAERQSRRQEGRQEGKARPGNQNVENDGKTLTNAT